MTKRSKRCPVTVPTMNESGVIVKPDMGAAKASFQRKHAAFDYVPRITVCRQPKADMLLVRFTNPLDHLVSFTVEPWLRPGDKDREKPYLFPVPEVSTTVGAKEDIPALADKPRDLKEEDDHTKIHSRTTNSVVIRLVAPEPLTTPIMQARLKVAVKIEEDGLDSLTFCVLVNVPLTECAV